MSSPIIHCVAHIQQIIVFVGKLPNIPRYIVTTEDYACHIITGDGYYVMENGSNNNDHSGSVFVVPLSPLL